MRIIDAVKTITPPEVPSIGPEHSLRYALQTISKNRTSGLMVLSDENRLLGIVNEADILMQLGEFGPALFERPAHTFMDSSLFHSHPDDLIKTVLQDMSNRSIRYTIVETDPTPGVLLSTNDLVRARLKSLEAMDATDLELYRQL